MDSRRLEIFLKLFESRSFSKTAQAMGMTQPSVSASLKALEEHLGQKLFERTPRSVKPLPAADVLLPYAVDIVETAAKAAWAVGHQLAGPRETLKLGASSVPASVLLPPAMSEFHQKFPGILLTLKTGRSRGIIRQVAEGELDIGLAGSLPEEDGLMASPCGRDHLVLLASKNVAAEMGTRPQSAEDLADWPLIMREEGSGTRAAFLAGFGAKAGEMAGRIKVVAEVEGQGPLLALVRSSFGAAVVSGLIIPTIKMDDLVAMPLEFLGRRNFYLIRRSSHKPLPAMEAMIEILAVRHKRSAGKEKD